MLKKSFNLLLKLNIIVILCLFLCSCASKAPVADDTVEVVAVNFAQYDFARAVCGDAANVKMIIRPGAEVHGYEPSLADILAIENADVFIYGGGEGDVWIDEILSNVDISSKIVVPLIKAGGITLYAEESHTHHGEPHHTGEHYDQHIWTSPKNAIRIVELIKDAVSRADSKNATVYAENADAYIKKLRELDLEFTELTKSARTDFIAVADRFPFLYLAKEYNLKYIAAFSTCSPESDAGPAVLAHMADEIKKRKTDTVFYIELSNQKMADAVCENTGAKKRLLHSCQTISRQDFENGVTYIDLMNRNLQNLKEAIG